MTTGPTSSGHVESPAPPHSPLSGGGLPPEGVGVPASDQDLAPMPESMGQFLGNMLWWVVPVLLIAIGLMLGWADQDAGAAANDDLRIPAMIAALLLFGQGLTDLSVGRSKPDEVEAEAAAEEVEAPGDDAATGPLPARLLSQGSTAASSPSAASALAIGLMVLGVWLGVKVLTVSAPPQLSNLSLLAAFLLFAFGWKVLTRGQ